MYGTPLSPEERALRRRADPMCRASDDYPSVEIAGHCVHVFDAGDGFEIWLNTESEDFDGIVIGTGTTRNDAVAEAVAALEAIVEFLQGPPLDGAS